MNWRATVGVCVLEREGVLCGKLAGADTGETLADIGADGCFLKLKIRQFVVI